MICTGATLHLLPDGPWMLTLLYQHNKNDSMYSKKSKEKLMMQLIHRIILTPKIILGGQKRESICVPIMIS